LKSFAVKHVAGEMGPLVSHLSIIIKNPYSLTNKKAEANAAAQDNFIYVIEVTKEKSKTIYRLGYKFRSSVVHKQPGSAKWSGGFEFKNAIESDKPVKGYYFENPVEIMNLDFNDWYREERFGMTKMPPDLVKILDEVFDEPLNSAKRM